MLHFRLSPVGQAHARSLPLLGARFPRLLMRMPFFIRLVPLTYHPSYPCALKAAASTVCMQRILRCCEPCDAPAWLKRVHVCGDLMHRPG